MKRKKRLVISVIAILIIVMIPLILNSKAGYKKYTESDIEQITGTSVSSDKDKIFGIEYTLCYSINYENPQNNYQQLEYMLFDSPITARKVFRRLRSRAYMDSTKTQTPNFVSGRLEGVCDAFVYSFYLLKGNMLVTAELSVGAYFINPDERAEREAEDAERIDKYNELEKWVLNEAKI
jgi:hypothetical protein